jgi:hypothetical protein
VVAAVSVLVLVAMPWSGPSLTVGQAGDGSATAARWCSSSEVLNVSEIFVKIWGFFRYVQNLINECG